MVTAFHRALRIVLVAWATGASACSESAGPQPHVPANFEAVEVSVYEDGRNLASYTFGPDTPIVDDVRAWLLAEPDADWQRSVRSYAPHLGISFGEGRINITSNHVILNQAHPERADAWRQFERRVTERDRRLKEAVLRAIEKP